MYIQVEKETSARQYRIATAVFFFISGLGYSSFVSRIPSIKEQLHLNDAELGAVLFALPIGLMLTMPVTSKLLGKFSSRKIMIYGALFFNLVLSVPGFTNSIWQLAFVFFCFGSARNFLNLSMNAQSVQVQKLFPRSILTTFHAIWSIAGSAGVALGNLAVRLHVPATYHLMFVSFLLLIATFLFAPKTYPDQPVISTQKKKAFTLPPKSLLRFSFICFFCMATENTMYDWSSLYFSQVIGTTEAAALNGFLVYMVAMTTGRLLGDRIVHKLGIKQMLQYSGWLVFAGLSTAVLFPYSIPAGIGFILTGFGVACVVPLIFSLAGKVKNTNSGQTLAAISTIGYLGFLIAPPLIGFISQASSLRVSFAVMIIGSVFIIWMVSGLKEE
ncbi:fucose permease [Chitinophaga skermanii]|uniref:Fucose permease n=1 Tax=Chitinophaga skermanii TaxID=331697 RepID=A0A327QS12_9BACT|nr:MFS transporter [Chitinophaga skermanii]RAJ06482.1 fucose permease [Chitinophaga skermanii]